ncbi:3-keto-steroid reductase [Tilletia horrida]|nr:3-keto-steroid reductase [Tilletia horrida]
MAETIAPLSALDGSTAQGTNARTSVNASNSNSASTDKATGRGTAGRRRPVIVVTGANGGVGYGICQRLLVQLSSPIPPDTLPEHPSKRHAGSPLPPPSPFAAPNGVTLVLACRNAIKAHRARLELQALLDNLAALPDEVDTPLSPPVGLGLSSQGPHGNIDEDADPAVVAQAIEASIRRRRRRSAAALAHGNGTGKEGSGEDDFGSPDDGDDEQDAEDERETEALLGESKHDRLRVPSSVGRGSRADGVDLHGVNRNLELAQREAKARGKYRRRFCAGTRIEFVPLDLGSMASALKCANEITERYKYVTHIILNAGVGPFTSLNWFHALYLCFTNFHRFVTYPAYKRQRKGDISDDGYGWVWQSNVGAHYILVRALLPALRATPYSTPSRIIWTGSIEGFRVFYDEDDFQCVQPPYDVLPYESTKYQCELAAVGLDEVLRSSRIRSAPGTPFEVDLRNGKTEIRAEPASVLARDEAVAEQGLEPRSYLVHPGVVASSIAAAVFTFAILETLMKWAFYVARWTLSPHHNIEAYKGAVSAVHVSLAPERTLDASRKYGSRCDFRGREYCHPDAIDGWKGNRFDDQPPHELPPAIALEQRDGRWNEHPDGARVMVLARDYLRKMEGVAAKVWAEAAEESLPPWPALRDLGAPIVVGASLLPKSRRGSKVGPAVATEPGTAIAAQGNGAAVGGTAAAATVTGSGSGSGEGSLAGSEEWEKVQA